MLGKSQTDVLGTDHSDGLVAINASGRFQLQLRGVRVDMSSDTSARRRGCRAAGSCAAAGEIPLLDDWLTPC